MMQEKLWTKGFVLLTAVQTIDMFTYYMVAPVIAKYAIEMGVVVALSGLAATMFAVVSIVARPLSGIMSDRLGRKRILVVALAIGCLAQFGYAFIPGFGPLLAMRAVHGFFYALFGTAISAMALDSLPESRRSEGMGWFGTAYVVGAVAGPALGVYLSDTLGFQAMFVIAGIMAGAGFVMGLFLQGGEPVAPDGASSALTSAGAKTAVAANKAASSSTTTAPAAANASTTTIAPTTSAPNARRGLRIDSFISIRCIPYALIVCVFYAIWAVITTYIVIVGDARGIVGTSAFFVVNSLMLFATRPLWGKIVDRRGLQFAFAPAVVFEAIALVLLAVSQQLWLVLLAAGIKACGSGGVLPSIQAACGKLEPGRSGVAMSTYLLGGDIGYAIGPLIGGVLLDAVGQAGLFWAMLPIDALAAIVFAYLAVQMRKQRG